MNSWHYWYEGFEKETCLTPPYRTKKDAMIDVNRCRAEGRKASDPFQVVYPKKPMRLV